jgi:hypothetical protein
MGSIYKRANAGAQLSQSVTLRRKGSALIYP